MSITENKQKILLIDGNYFSMRSIGQLNMGDTVNNLESESEQKLFKSNLYGNFVSLVRTFQSRNLINQVIIVSDFKSWRKKVEPFKPYYIPIDSTKPIGYKEQRVAVKEESPINYDNFYRIHNEFIDELKNLGILSYKIEGLEGDDLICLFSNYGKDKSVEIVCFCTDGDLVQCVRDNFHLFRNIRSKEAPNGEIVINQKMYDLLYETKKSTNEFADLLPGAFLNDHFIKDIATIQLGDIYGENKVIRKINGGINIAYPFKTLLTKIICGDKKDNIFSLMSWMSSTGTREYKLTEKMLEKAFELCNLPFTDANALKVISKPENQKTVIIAVGRISKQSINIDSCLLHFKHNLKMLLLNKQAIPEEYVKIFDELINIDQDKILTDNLNIEEFVLKVPTNISTENRIYKDIYKESLPDDLNSIIDLD
jgi:hypothetical protein